MSATTSGAMMMPQVSAVLCGQEKQGFPPTEAVSLVSVRTSTSLCLDCPVERKIPSKTADSRRTVQTPDAKHKSL